jgi:hypothetical protein
MLRAESSAAIRNGLRPQAGFLRIGGAGANGENRRVGNVAALRLLRLANPFVRAVLSSRLHGALSGRLVLVAYSGRRSGRRFRIPLRYAPTADGAVVAVALRPERKQWWRAFAPAGPATLTLRGADVPADGQLATGEARAAALEAYLGRYPRSRGVAHDAAVVVFRPVDG